MIIFSAIISSILIILCIGATGFWIEASVAALGGGICAAYLQRTSIGRIDTDQLNLGLYYALFGLALMVSRVQTKKWAFVICVLLGLLSNVFMWWYSKPELIFILLASLTFALVSNFKNLPFAGLCITTVIILSGIDPTDYTISKFLQPELTASGFIYPNTLDYISELQTLSLTKLSLAITGTIELTLVGILGLVLFFFRNPKAATILSPLIGFACLNIIIGNRAIFYSAPMIWFGIAFIVTEAARYIARQIGTTVLTEKKRVLPY